MTNVNNKNSKGFTLIELLIVIAIIGILSSVVLASLNSARLKARNVQRISQFVQVKKALEMYYDDHGAYPATGGSTSGAGTYGDCDDDVHQDDPNNIIPGLVPAYISEIKSDPKHVYVAGVTNIGCTLYISEGRDYSFVLQRVQDQSPSAAWFDYSGYPTFLDKSRDGGSDSCVLEGDGIDNGDNNAAWAIKTDGVCAGEFSWFW